MMSKRLTFVFGVVVAISAHGVSAENDFLDDFRDGSVTNEVPLDHAGNPVVWQAYLNSDLSATTGDLKISGTNFAAAQRLNLGLTDISVRSQLRILDGEIIGLAARTTTNNGSDGYVASISLLSNTVAISRAGSKSDVVASVPTTLDPTQQDIMVQLDAIGNQISLWTWAAGEAMPAEPTVTVQDDTFDGAGGVSLWTATKEFFEGGTSEATSVYRFVQVADQHIVPEPSSAMLAVLGFGWLIGVVRGHSLISRGHAGTGMGFKGDPQVAGRTFGEPARSPVEGRR